VIEKNGGAFLREARTQRDVVPCMNGWTESACRAGVKTVINV
jgi:hypothetical protein